VFMIYGLDGILAKPTNYNGKIANVSNSVEQFQTLLVVRDQIGALVVAYGLETAKNHPMSAF
jgi:hypothetical protein